MKMGELRGADGTEEFPSFITSSPMGVPAEVKVLRSATIACSELWGQRLQLGRRRKKTPAKFLSKTYIMGVMTYVFGHAVTWISKITLSLM